MKRDKVNLDIFWLKDEALEESAHLPPPEIIAADIAPRPRSRLGAVRNDCGGFEGLIGVVVGCQ
jgi:hypothetical protein